tara:strand:+ start:758 stop:1057 length:300 start_codon:yes stop_codon:yes gene_type:complete
MQDIKIKTTLRSGFLCFEMKNKNLVLRYFGLFLLVIGIILNVKMYIDETWPTYLFFIISAIGIIQVIISFTVKRIKVSWQIFWASLPIVLGFIYIKLLS